MTHLTELWQQVAEHMDAGVALVDRDLAVRFWNPWLEAHTGVSRREIEGRPLGDRFPKLRSSGAEARLAEAVALGTSAIFSHAFHEALFPTVGGVCGAPAPHYQEVKALALRSDGEIAGLALLVYDVTELVLRAFAMTEAARELAALREQMERMDQNARLAAPLVEKALALLEGRG